MDDVSSVVEDWLSGWKLAINHSEKIEPIRSGNAKSRLRMIYLYEKNKHRPYFAKIVFQKDGEKEKTFAYIGRIGFANLNQDDIIIDWRAPISELYYNSK